MEQELKHAELLHENLSQSLKSEEDIKLETLRYQRNIDSIKRRHYEAEKNHNISIEPTQKHIAWAKQEIQEREHCH